MSIAVTSAFILLLLSVSPGHALEVEARDVDQARAVAPSLTLTERALLEARVIIGTYVINEIQLKRSLMRFVGVDERRSSDTLVLGTGTAIAELIVGSRLLEQSRRVADRAFVRSTHALYRDLGIHSAEIRALKHRIWGLKRERIQSRTYVVNDLTSARRAMIHAMRQIREANTHIVAERSSASYLRRAVAGMTRTVGVTAGFALIFDASQTFLRVTFEPSLLEQTEASWTKYVADAEATLRGSEV